MNTIHQNNAPHTITPASPLLRGVAIATLAAAAVLATFATSACRTTEGAGQDLSHLGDNISDSADKHKP